LATVSGESVTVIAVPPLALYHARGRAASLSILPQYSAGKSAGEGAALPGDAAVDEREVDARMTLRS
jgi:hypothetical protein